MPRPGEAMIETFAAHDLTQQADTDEKLLALRPRMSPNARLEQVCAQHEGQWRAESLTLRLISGFPFHMSVQPLVAEFLVSCDGTHTAGEAIQAFAAQANAPRESVETECLSMIRKLIERGFMVAA